MRPEAFTEKKKGYAILICIALIAVTLAVYVQVGNHEFSNYDDSSYVTRNPNVASGLSGKNVIWAFQSVAAANWHPVTWLSHMADVQFYGMNPRGHHLTSVVIHIVSSLLLLLLLLRVTGSLWQSSFVAALFALHPMHVESVAWVAERKDVLSAFFWFLTLILYSEYVRRRKSTLYLLSFSSFILGLMSKPMLVTLPVVMILMDFWPLNRFREERHLPGQCRPSGGHLGIVKEKIPFFVCSLISCLVTIYAQNKGGAVKNLAAVPFGHRIENALIAYAKYIIKLLWPHDLAPIYPIPSAFPLWQVIGSLSLLLIVSLLTIRARHRQPYLFVGWFWYLVTLVPVIGIIQVGEQSMADRYTYIPATGIFIMAAWGGQLLTNGRQQREKILALFAVAVLAVSAVSTWNQIHYWRDDITLFRRTLQVTDSNYVAHYNLAFALSKKGDVDASILEYQEALRIKPNGYEALNNLGAVLEKKGDLKAAVTEYQAALSLQPAFAEAHSNLGFALASTGDLDGAILEYQEALRLKPNMSGAHNNLGFALASKGNLDAAIVEFQEALRQQPDFADAHRNLGFALINKGRLDAAIHEFQEVLRQQPGVAETHYNLGFALASKGDLNAAILEYQEALRMSPDNEKAQSSLKIALDQKRSK